MEFEVKPWVMRDFFLFSDTGYFNGQFYVISFHWLVCLGFFYIREFWIRGVKGIPWTGSSYWNNLHGVLENNGIVRCQCVPAVLQPCLGEQERAGSELAKPNFLP